MAVLLSLGWLLLGAYFAALLAWIVFLAAVAALRPWRGARAAQTSRRHTLEVDHI